jgi:hypothetical protein
LKFGAKRVTCATTGVGGALALLVPRPAGRQRVAEVLAEEARDVAAGGRERIVDRARDQHLHDRLLRPARRARAGVGAVHEAERRRHDDPAAMVRRGLAAAAAP